MSQKEMGRETAIRKTVKKRNKRRKRKLLIFFSAFLVIALAVLVVLSATVLFPVKNIIVEGKSPYTTEEIISASGIEDDNIIMLSSTKVKNRISKKLPLSGDISISKKFPDTVKIMVNTAVPAYYFFSDEIFYIADEEYKIIKKDVAAPEKCKYLKVSELNVVDPGSKLKLTADDEAQINEISAICGKYDFTVTAIDVSKDLDLKIILKDKLLVLLGSNMDLEGKFLHLSAILPKMSDTAQGTIDLRNWTSSNVKSIFRDEKINILDFCAQNEQK